MLLGRKSEPDWGGVEVEESDGDCDCESAEDMTDGVKQKKARNVSPEPDT